VAICGDSFIRVDDETVRDVWRASPLVRGMITELCRRMAPLVAANALSNETDVLLHHRGKEISSRVTMAGKGFTKIGVRPESKD
jgi:hypothetical protein